MRIGCDIWNADRLKRPLHADPGSPALLCDAVANCPKSGSPAELIKLFGRARGAAGRQRTRYAVARGGGRGALVVRAAIVVSRLPGRDKAGRAGRGLAPGRVGAAVVAVVSAHAAICACAAQLVLDCTQVQPAPDLEVIVLGCGIELLVPKRNVLFKRASDHSVALVQKNHDRIGQRTWLGVRLPHHLQKKLRVLVTKEPGRSPAGKRVALQAMQGDLVRICD
eukprot:SAG22_NODE_4074_length_1395_cov_2.347222_2_plen_223_part_00